MAELFLGAIVLVAVTAFVAERYGEAGIEVLAFLALVVLDLVMMAALFAVAVAENCDRAGGWECSRPAGIGLAVGIAGATFGMVALLARVRERDSRG